MLSSFSSTPLHHKIATNKKSSCSEAAPPFGNALIPSKVSKLHRDHCAEWLIPTQVGKVFQNFCFQAIGFPSKTIPRSNLS